MSGHRPGVVLQRLRGQPRRAGLLLAAVQAGLLLLLGGQMLLERLSRPRGWGLTAPVDPNLPIRGRYIRLGLRVPAPALALNASTSVRLVVRNGLVEAIDPARAMPGSTEPLPASILPDRGGAVAQLRQPLAFFLPPQVADPSLRPAGERLWVEVTLPERGAPRPLRLGVAREGSVAIAPLRLR